MVRISLAKKSLFKMPKNVQENLIVTFKVSKIIRKNTINNMLLILQFTSFLTILSRTRFEQIVRKFLPLKSSLSI